MLLPAALAKEAARSEGAKEAWFVDEEGYVTEGASSNAWIVDKDGPPRHAPDRQRHPARRHAHHADRCARSARASSSSSGPFTVAEAKAAREAFITSATNTVMPVVRIDGQPDRQRRSRACSRKGCGPNFTGRPELAERLNLLAIWQFGLAGQRICLCRAA